MARIFADTSAIYALLDRKDRNHGAAVALLRTMGQRREVPLLSNFVVAETYGLLQIRLGPKIARGWLFGNLWPIERVTSEDEARARDILRRYDDRTFSYVDASSFAVMERLRLSNVLAFDAHFRQFGFQLYGESSTPVS